MTFEKKCTTTYLRNRIIINARLCGGFFFSFSPAGVPQGFLMEPLFFSVFFINHRGSGGSSPGIFLKHSVSESG